MAARPRPPGAWAGRSLTSARPRDRAGRLGRLRNPPAPGGYGDARVLGAAPQLLATPSAQAALWLSIRTCLSSTVVCVVLGVPLALLLARSWPGVRIARILAVLPMTMPPVVAGIALLSTLGNRGLLGRT